MFSLKQAGRGASVYAFEPNPQVYERLVRNVEQNAMPGRIVAFRQALGSRAGQAALKTTSSTVSLGWILPTSMATCAWDHWTRPFRHSVSGQFS
jgi:FkbM family methyltransferase